MKWLLLFLLPIVSQAALGLRDPAYIASSAPTTAPTTPLSFSNIFVWWRSDATGSNYNDGDKVDLWTNGGAASAYLLKSAADTRRANFSNNWFNGQPAICFDGVDDAYSITQASGGYKTLSAVRPFTAVAIGRVTSAGTITAISADVNAQICAVGISPNGTNWMRTYRDPTYPVVSTGIAFTNKFMHVFQSRSSPAENRFWNDLDTGTNLTTSIDVYFDYVGSYQLGSFFKWEMAEFLIFTNNYLTGAQITNLYNLYAKPKYGLP